MAETKSTNTFFVMFVTAVSYFLVGKFGLFLAIPPGYASPVWPAAGVAMAMILQFGRPAIVGTYLGSMATNDFFFHLVRHFSGHAVPASTFILAFAIALGATIQPVIVAALIRRRFQWPLRLSDDGTLIKFLFVLVLLSHMVSPTIGLSALLLTQKISWSGAPLTWSTWWVGDSLGSVLVFPMIWCLWGTPRSLWQRRSLYLPPVVLGSLAVLTWVYFSASRRVEEGQQITYTKIADSRIENIKTHLKYYDDQIKALAAACSLVSNVSSKQLKTLGSNALLDHPEIVAFNWVVAFESKYQDYWLGRLRAIHPKAYFYNIDPTLSDRIMVPVTDMMAIVFQNTAVQDKSFLIGADLFGEKSRREAGLASLQHGGSVATAPVQLRDNPVSLGFIVYVKVPRQLDKSIADFAVVALKFNEIFDPLTKTLPAELGVSIHDKAYPDIEVFHRGPAVDEPGKGLYWQYELKVYNRVYNITMAVPASFIIGHPNLEAWFVMIVGLFLAVLVCALGLSITSKETYLHEKIAIHVAEIDRNRAQAAESAKLVSLGMMASGLAHEINNPLSIITGYCFHLRRAHDENPQQFANILKPITVIDQTVQRIAAIIQALRTYSRRDSNDPLEAVYIPELIKDTMALCFDQIKHHGITIDTSLIQNSKPPIVQGRKAALMQVMLNLINNAKDALAQCETKVITIRLKANAGFVEILVEDSGLGIADDVATKIMEPFFTTKPPGQGTGLGLSLCSLLLQAMGGSLELRSKRQPTQFAIKLRIQS